MNTQRVCQIHDPWRNIDYYEGTVAFWVRKDPVVRNENTFVGDPKATAGMGIGRSNYGETLITAGGCFGTGISLRRFRSWRGRDGYLQLTYQNMGGHKVVCQYSPFNWTEQWRHVAFLWSVKDRRLELYVDGKPVAKADGGTKEWMPAPWDRGTTTPWDLNILTTDHGAWSGTCRDEVYIYNRALSAEQIAANKALAKKE